MKRALLIIVFFLNSLQHDAWARNNNQCSINLTNQEFRNLIVSEINVFANKKALTSAFSLSNLTYCFNNHYQKANLMFNLTCYENGLNKAEVFYSGKHILQDLSAAVNKIKDIGVKPENCQFKMDFIYYPDRHYSFVEYQNQGLELTGNRVAVRKLTLDLLKNQIKDSIGYLRKVQHKRLNGFYKFYDARHDKSETKLRTIYSSSSLYTYMLAQKILPELELSQHFEPIADFILSQQINQGPEKGAFYYSYDPLKKKPENKIVVGTASKTIFTLIELDRYYPNNSIYLNSATNAADWLTKQVLADGKVIPEKTLVNGKWEQNEKQSRLYSGQVLSALSRFYLIKNDTHYRDKAKLIADLFVKIVQEDGTLLGDDYRPPNLISTSWVLRSLMDFYEVALKNDDLESEKYLQTIMNLANTIVNLQITNKSDIHYCGKFSDSMTTSGNGWLNEVLGDYYSFCTKHNLKDCEKFKEATILSSRYLIQNAYRKDNTYNIPNPENAIGAFALSYNNHKVRTDAVCHGVNGFIYLLQNVGDKQDILLDIPEEELMKIFPLIRAGNVKID